MKENRGWIIAWILGVIVMLLLVDDIKMSKIVIDQENKLKECKDGR